MASLLPGSHAANCQLPAGETMVLTLADRQLLGGERGDHLREDEGDDELENVLKVCVDIPSYPCHIGAVRRPQGVCRVALACCLCLI
jgi:hypothetical protein